MSFFSRVLAVAALLSAGAACNSGRHSSSAFHLPAGGDPEKGKLAFVSLGCNSCHRVSGTDLPRPAVQPLLVPVVLGGEVYHPITDAYLVTAMIDPSYELAPYPKNQITRAGLSRMPGYAETMSVRQVMDVAAFLQSHYTVRQIPPSYGLR